MLVIIPYVGEVNPRVDKAVIAATRYGHAQRWYDVSGSDRAYFDLLRGLWNAGGAFTIIEHDVIVHPTAITELDACPEDWCAFPYDYGEWGLTYGLGCVKFSRDLILRNPDALQKVGVLSDARHPKRHWCRLDAFLQGVILPNAGETLHRHETPVTHLGRGCAHGCAA